MALVRWKLNDRGGEGRRSGEEQVRTEGVIIIGVMGG